MSRIVGRKRTGGEVKGIETVTQEAITLGYR